MRVFLQTTAIHTTKILYKTGVPKAVVARYISERHGVSLATPYRYMNTDKNKYNSEKYWKQNRDKYMAHRQGLHIPIGTRIQKLLQRGLNSLQVAQYLGVDLGKVNRLIYKSIN